MNMDKDQHELIRRIASVVGHELRNPLAVINNSSYFVKTKLAGQKDAKVEKHLGIIASEIARADRLIGDMLFFSRPLEFKPEPARLAALVAEALGACDIPAGVKVKRDSKKPEPSVNADARVLSDAVRRLIDNALAAMEGSGTLTIAVGAGSGGAFVEVRDTGPGIKPEALASLFQPFFTTKHRGLGLGLAVAQKAAQAHRGRIEAKNLAGGGAAFTLTLPPA